MKKYIFLFLIFQIICINECLSFYNIKNDTTKRKLLVTKIEKTKKAYIIEVVDIETNYLYTIVSLRVKNIQKNKFIKIKEGQKYCFITKSYLKNDYIPNIGLYIPVSIENITIYVKNTGINIFTTPNLKGLYYIPPDSMQIKTNP